MENSRYLKEESWKIMCVFALRLKSIGVVIGRSRHGTWIEQFTHHKVKGNDRNEPKLIHICHG
jgi:hypothetical protein